MKTIDNKVKTLKTTDAQTFLSWEFNSLKDDKNRDVTALKKSITTSGWSFPVFVWQGHNYVIDGTGRRKAVTELLKEGWDIPEIPYVEIEAESLAEAKQKALEVSSQFGTITKDSFVSFMGDDIDIVDWESINIGVNYEDVFAEPDEKDDEVPEVPTVAQSKPGDLYELGNHRILCGDSTSGKDLDRLMGGHKADMVFTDPPYNVDYKGSGSNTKNGIMNDKMSDKAFLDFLTDTFLVMKANIKEGAGCYIFHSHKTAYTFEEALKANNFVIDTQLIWNKPSAGLGMNHYRTKHEPFFYCALTKEKVFYGDRTGTTVWKIPEDTTRALEWFKKNLDKTEGGGGTVWTLKRANVNEYVHPTQKPVELVAKAIHNSSKKGDIILDQFLGSGSTIIACEKSGRNCYGMELDPHYIDVIIERWLNITGQSTVIKNGEEILWKFNPTTDSE